ncbi:hypothetical protein BDY19DRAFT_957303 [Irpex rosettiformis]|uniref:Uncharacterized protein n=1 Tax=Irpex rosettiformis TaxID=378272 RepID=A0ACB8TY22_9APHY|nr:hypothetical protein BDY19DRAFT_957303 [Irpex rosettiformis]
MDDPPAPRTLKERIAMLAANVNKPSLTSSGGPSSPSSPSFSVSNRNYISRTNVPKRRAPPPVPPKRHSSLPPHSHGYREDKVQEVMTRVIFQAGVDYETRPIVVMNASALPDPKEVSYDVLLSRILAYLNLYVESDYTVVFFAAGGRNTPGWNWVWKAYRSLSRKYRKNLKKLLIVHSNFFTKMLFSLAGAIISPKFFRKISYVNTLSDLALQVPITQIDIPPAVYQENLKYEKQIVMPTPTHADLFGVPLEELMGYDGEKGGVPRVVKDCVQYLRDSGLQDEGIFRRSPSSALLKQVQQAYDRGHVVSLNTFADPHLAAVLLKKYLRDLPDPIFSEKVYPIIRRCPPPPSSDPNDPNGVLSVQYIRETVLPELAPCAVILLSNILHLLHDVSLRSTSNKMDAHNLAVVITPNLVKSSNPIKDVQICVIPNGPSLHPSARVSHPEVLLDAGETNTTLGQMIKFCIERYYEVFDEVRDPTEARPSGRGSGSGSGEQEQEISYRPMQRTLQGPISPSLHSHPSRNRDSVIEDSSDEDEDHEILVMPIGPDSRLGGGAVTTTNGAPSAWTPASRLSPTSARHPTPSRSVYSGVPSTASPYGTCGRTKSLISIEPSPNGVDTRRGGSISIGTRGTVRGGRGGKGSGSGVEALGVTASGFFTAPGLNDVPPPPPRHPSVAKP